MTQTFHVPAFKSTFTSVFSLKVFGYHVHKAGSNVHILNAILLLKKEELTKKQDIYLTTYKFIVVVIHAPFKIDQWFIVNFSVR